MQLLMCKIRLQQQQQQHLLWFVIGQAFVTVNEALALQYWVFL
jgi:hypothetical protein